MASMASPPPVTTNSPTTTSPTSSSSSSILRLMISFNGRIVPRPATKSLCYLGGETRIISIPRSSSLSQLKSKLSLSLLSNRPFTLKYQLPTDDLDALISVSTDVDLENMIDEYDRLNSSPSSTRLRIFLFPAQFDASPSSTVGSLMDDDSWFVEALNGAENCVVGVEEGGVMRRPESMGKLGSGRDSPMMDKMSSFGSAASAPALSNLPPIVDRVEERGMVESCLIVEEKWLEEGFKEPQPPSFTPQLIHHGALPVVSAASSTVSSTENSGRVLPEDDKSDRGSRGVVKTVEAAKPAQVDSFVSDFSPRAVYSNVNSDPKREPVSPNANYQYRMPVAADVSAYGLSVMQEEQLKQPQSNSQLPPPSQPQLQRQYIPVNPHYIQQQGMGTVLPIPSFYHPIAAQQIQQSQHVAPQYDPNVQMYYLPVRANPAYNLAAVPTATLGDPSLIQSAGKPAVPVTRVPVNPESHTNMYRPGAATASPAMLQQPVIHIGTDQSHPYAGIGYQVMQHHQISQAPATLANFGYEYTTANSMHPQVYYSRATSPPAVPPQFQTVTSGVVTADAIIGNTKATRAS